MTGIQILLLISIEDDFHFVQYFPKSYEQPNLISELLLISKFFQNCRKGCLLNNNKIYFYRTYIPTNNENNISNIKHKIFIIFLCDILYKQKYIDEFTNNIFDLLAKEAFEGNRLNQNISNTVNNLFNIYKNINNKEEIYLEYVHNLMNNAMENNNNNNEHNTSTDNELSFTRKRVDSKFFREREKSLSSVKGLNTSGIMENIEMVKITENDTDLTLMLKDNKYNYYFMEMKRYKKIQIINIIIFGLIGLVTFILIPILIAI